MLAFSRAQNLETQTTLSKSGYHLNRNEKIASVLVVSSIGFWASLLLVPFVADTHSSRAILWVILIVAGEATFWIGVLIVGREVMKRVRNRFWPKKWSLRTNNSELIDDAPAVEPVSEKVEDI